MKTCSAEGTEYEGCVSFVTVIAQITSTDLIARMLTKIAETHTTFLSYQ
jgi:hypothetical protein